MNGMQVMWKSLFSCRTMLIVSCFAGLFVSPRYQQTRYWANGGRAGVSPELKIEIADTLPMLAWEGIKGSLVIVGGGQLPEVVQRRFVDLAGGDQARIVVIPTASMHAEDVLADEERHERLLRLWKTAGAADVRAFHTRSRESANDAEFIEPLRRATGIWFESGQQSVFTAAYLGTGVEQELYALLERGGVIGGTSAGAAIQSRVMIAGGNPEPRIATGLDLLPGCIVDQHFGNRNRKPRLMKALAEHPGLLGVGVDEGTALIVQGRRLEVAGEANVTVILHGSQASGKSTHQLDLKPGEIHDFAVLRHCSQTGVLPTFPQIDFKTSTE